MSTEVYSSANATIRNDVVEIKDDKFAVSDIEEISSFDELSKAKGWASWGLKVGGSAVVLVLLASAANLQGILPRPIRFVLPFALLSGFVAFLFGAGALLVYRLRPSAGAGLVVSTKDGKAVMINGIHRDEVAAIRDAVRGLISTKINHS